MNILFCNYEYPPLGGGGGVVNAWLAEELARQHNVTVLTSRETVNNVDVLRVPVYFRKELQAANMPSLAAFVVNGLRMAKEITRMGDFDIVNTHFVLPTGPVGARISKVLSVPNVLSVHGGDLYDPSKFMSPHRHAPLRVAARQLLRSADAVVGQSENTISNVNHYYDKNILCEKIPLGIPRVTQPSPIRQELGITEDEVVLITVGRLVSRKGVEQLVEQLHSIKDNKLRLVIVGDGPKLAELKKLAESLGVASRVHFAGQVSEDEKLALLAGADIFVSTSQHEGFGLVFLEGMAAGLPVICYNHGGQTDFIADEQHGFVVRLNDKETFKSRIERLAQDKQLRQTLSQNCVKAVEHYFIDTCASQYVDLFERCISAHDQRLANAI